jgi:rubrerythrin
MATEQRNQQGKGKHPHLSTKEPWPHRQGAADKASARGSTGAGGSRKQSSSAKAPNRTTKGASEAQDQSAEREAAAEGQESEDDRDAHVNTLLAIAQMDSEAATAYETVAELVSSPAIRARLEEFAGDHRRHIDDLGHVIEELGGDAEIAAPPPETSVFSMLGLAVASLGDRAALMALVGNELFTNATYSTALELVTDSATLALLDRNLRDEQRHISWLTQQTRAEEASSEDADAAEE